MARRALALLLLVLAVAMPSAVYAAVAYRISTDPPQPILGESANILVATFEYVPPPSTPSVPLPLDEFLWTFVAESPSGRTHVVDLAAVQASTNEWSGSFTFDEVGSWEIGLDRSHLGTPVDPSLGARVTVTVRADDGSSPIGILAAAVAGLLLAVVLATRSRSARRSPPGGATDEGATAIGR